MKKLKQLLSKPEVERTYYFKGFAKDITGRKLGAYKKKGHTYYNGQSKSPERVSISEKLIFEKCGELMKEYDIQNQTLKSIDKDILLDLLVLEEKDNLQEVIDSKSLIAKIEDKQEKLLDMQLELTISKDIFLKKNNALENQKIEILEEEKNSKNENFEQKSLLVLELIESLYETYIGGNKNRKVDIIRKLGLELFISTKKELWIEENHLSKTLKFLKILYGTP